MGISKNNNVEVLALPVSEITKEKCYSGKILAPDDLIPHSNLRINELNNFLKEICSQYALRIEDIVKIVRMNEKSFGPITWSYIDDISDKQLKSVLLSFIYAIRDAGYGPIKELLPQWKVFLRTYDPRSIKKNFFLSLLDVFCFRVKKYEYFLYAEEFVNPYTLARNEIPLHINREWGNIYDKQFYMKLLKKHNVIAENREKPDIDSEDAPIFSKTNINLEEEKLV